MRKFLVSCLLAFTFLAHSQEVVLVAAYNNNYNGNSGIFGITNNAVYEYSWYYAAWLQLPVNGLPVVGGDVKIDLISTFDNNSLNPSGVYVFADSAVFVYNYYAELWYPLSNEGLCRVGGKAQVTSLSAHLDSESDYVYVYAVSCGSVYYYRWYYNDWLALSNDGIETKLDLPDGNLSDFSVF
ncbi:MAG: hypothetical protein JXR58_02005, partial [Bacteroidales bacterium]|nr:hypothetical protein [Bacteroidales bacterium]